MLQVGSIHVREGRGLGGMEREERERNRGDREEERGEEERGEGGWDGMGRKEGGKENGEERNWDIKKREDMVYVLHHDFNPLTDETKTIMIFLRE